MQEDYQIQDLAYQTRELVIYRARAKNGIPHSLIRLKYPKEIIENLSEGRFKIAFDELRSLDHGCLRPVMDGGIDEVDQSPWIAARWWEGSILEEKLNQGPLSQEEFELLEFHGESLISELGERAGALDLTSNSIVATRSSDGQLIYTFAIDYHLWFLDWAMGYSPGGKRDALVELGKLLDAIRPSVAEKSLLEPNKLQLATKSPGALPAVLTPPPASSPSSPAVSLDQGMKPKKMIAIIALLLGLIGGGTWWAGSLSNEDETAEDKPRTERQETKPQLKKKTTPPTSKNKTVTALAKITKTEPAPKKEDEGRPPKPSGGGLFDLEPTPRSVKDLLNHWVILTATVATSEEGRSLTFEGLPDLKAQLEKGTTEAIKGNKVEVIGYLKSETLLEVESAEDIEIEGDDTPMLKDVYTLEDEARLRNMSQASVTVRATVTEFTKSQSGKTLYLVFKKEKPEFRAGVVLSQADNGLDEEYLRTFVGKEVLVTGQISGFELKSRSNRLVVVFRKKDAIKLTE